MNKCTNLAGLETAALLVLSAYTHRPVADRAPSLMPHGQMASTLSATRRYDHVGWWRSVGGESVHKLILMGQREQQSCP